MSREAVPSSPRGAHWPTLSSRSLVHALAPGFPGGANGIKNLPGDTGDARDVGLIPGLGRFPWSRKWRPAPVFLAWEIPCLCSRVSMPCSPSAASCPISSCPPDPWISPRVHPLSGGLRFPKACSPFPHRKSPSRFCVTLSVSQDCHSRCPTPGALNNRYLLSPSRGWNPRPRCWQGWSVLRPLSGACRRPSPPRVLTWASCVPKDCSPAGSGSTLMTSSKFPSPDAVTF